jgi:hypothetical protein
MTGKKFDADKPQVDLVPRQLIYGAARAKGFGAKKYGRHNWRGGIAPSRLVSACLRHLFAWKDGEDNDPESGLNHLDHAAATLGMLMATVDEGLADDDRPEENTRVPGKLDEPVRRPGYYKRPWEEVKRRRNAAGMNTSWSFWAEMPGYIEDDTKVPYRDYPVFNNRSTFQDYYE